MTHTIRVMPADLLVQVQDGQTLFEAAVSSGIRWPTVCYGEGQCGTCFVRVTAGGEHLSAMKPDEADRIMSGPHALRANVRLACQLTVHGDASVHRAAVKAASDETTPPRR